MTSHFSQHFPRCDSHLIHHITQLSIFLLVGIIWGLLWSFLLFPLKVVLSTGLLYYLHLEHRLVQVSLSLPSFWQNDGTCQCVLLACALSMSLSCQLHHVSELWTMDSILFPFFIFILFLFYLGLGINITSLSQLSHDCNGTWWNILEWWCHIMYLTHVGLKTNTWSFMVS